MKNRTLLLLSAGLFAIGFWIYSQKKKDDEARKSEELKNAELEKSKAAPGNTGIVPPPLATQGIVASQPAGGNGQTGYTVVVSKDTPTVDTVSLSNV